MAEAVQEAGPFRRPIVLALPRGGVPVAAHVARALEAPLDVMIVRKLGMPGQPELAIGALGPSGEIVLNEGLVRAGGITEEELAEIKASESEEIARRAASYRGGKDAPSLRDRTVILVDDGLATGATMSVAVRSARSLGARQVVVAVPVASPEACDRLRDEVDRVVCLMIPAYFMAVGQWYESFPQVTDDQVVESLRSFGVKSTSDVV